MYVNGCGKNDQGGRIIICVHSITYLIAAYILHDGYGQKLCHLLSLAGIQLTSLQQLVHLHELRTVVGHCTNMH